jgi:acetyl esterase/lipase
MRSGEGVDRGRRLFTLAAASLVVVAAAGEGLVGCTDGSDRETADDRLRVRSSDAKHPTDDVGPSVRWPYGSDRQQYGDLHLPSGDGEVPVVVLVHGGFWRAQYGLDLMDPLAVDVARRGWAAWNIEYRRLDHLAALRSGSAAIPGGKRLQLRHVAIVGHSAGGQLAVWAAGRAKFPAPGAHPKVVPVAAVSQAGVLDLVGAARQGVGGTVVSDLLGGSPAKVPDRYNVASPLARLPIGFPVRCSHGHQDTNVPFSQSERYVAAAKRAGDPAELAAFDGDHFDLIDPTHPSWQATATWLGRHLEP